MLLGRDALASVQLPWPGATHQPCSTLCALRARLETEHVTATRACFAWWLPCCFLTAEGLTTQHVIWSISQLHIHPCEPPARGPVVSHPSLCCAWGYNRLAKHACGLLWEGGWLGLRLRVHGHFLGMPSSMQLACMAGCSSGCCSGNQDFMLMQGCVLCWAACASGCRAVLCLAPPHSCVVSVRVWLCWRLGLPITVRQ